MTQDEITQLQTLLAKCQPGELPPEIFVSVARLAVMTAVEFVPLRQGANDVEVLLIPRPTDDPIWPGMLHTPGTVLRPTDESFESAFWRLTKDELGISKIPEMIFNGFYFGHSARGAGVTFEYIVTLDELPKYGSYYPCSDLPSNFITEQKMMLDRAVGKFKA